MNTQPEPARIPDLKYDSGFVIEPTTESAKGEWRVDGIERAKIAGWIAIIREGHQLKARAYGETKEEAQTTAAKIVEAVNFSGPALKGLLTIAKERDRLRAELAKEKQEFEKIYDYSRKQSAELAKVQKENLLYQSKIIEWEKKLDEALKKCNL